MASPPLLWLDFRQNPRDAGHFPWLLPSWSASRWAPPGDTGSAIRSGQPQFLCFEFDVTSIDELAILQKTRLQHPSMPILVIADSVSPAFTDWVFRIGVWDCLAKPVNADALNTCIEAFVHFCQQRHHGASPDSGCVQPTRPPRTQAAREYVATHFASEVRLPVAASLCHLSTSEFSRCFKKENGITFSDYLMHWRIQKACDLLAVPAMPIKTVAFEVGFNDVSYFARAFRRHTGVTPSTYQKNSGTDYHMAPAHTSAFPLWDPQA